MSNTMEETEDKSTISYQHHEHNNYYTNTTSSGNNITSHIEEDDLFEIGQFEVKTSVEYLDTTREMEEIDKSSLFSFDVNDNNRGNYYMDNCVYVGVGKSESSVDALSWTLKTLVGPSSNATTVFLVHIFPKVHSIPSPSGKLPKSQATREQLETFMVQERAERKELLQKFLDMCSASTVKVDTVLIESDEVAKALLDLIPAFNMRKLVLGIKKSYLRKSKTRRGNEIVDEVVQKAPEYCEVNIICKGKRVNDQAMMIDGSSSPRVIDDNDDNKSLQIQDKPTPTTTTNNNNKNSLALSKKHNHSFVCICFKSPRVAV